MLELGLFLICGFRNCWSLLEVYGQIDTKADAKIEADLVTLIPSRRTSVTPILDKPNPNCLLSQKTWAATWLAGPTRVPSGTSGKVV